MTIDVAAATRQLAEFERRLDPAHPERAGATVLAYGEISAALTITGAPALTGLVVKRMSGFADRATTTRYLDLVAEYLERLRGLGITVHETVAVPVQADDQRPSVYLLQPLLAAEGLGHRRLTTAGDVELAAAVRVVLDQTLKVFAANVSSPDDEIALDEQLSNWSFHGDAHPVLIDVGTPFIRRNGQHAFDQEILLSAVPPGIRGYYRRKGTASEYMDDYFEPRLVAVDLLGNFHKEGAPGRIPVGLEVVNEWLHGPAADYQRQLGGSVPVRVTEREVADYYRQDAATLALFLQVRRLDRAARRVLRRRYDFILPGRVKR